jgi:phenylalanyl-tRNA synthetase alpha chain
MVRSLFSSCARRCSARVRETSTESGAVHRTHAHLDIQNRRHQRDHVTNITPAVIAKIGRDLHRQNGHPVNIVKSRIESFVHSAFRSRGGLSPLFTAIDNLSPVVSVEQNFDSLLVPVDHVSRSRNDNYYINSSTMLRAHTSAHQRDIIKSGLNAFLVSGDVYRRDEIDSTHYPVFHQMEGVRLFTREELAAVCQEDSSSFELFGDCRGETEMRQAEHTREACRLVEFNLKETLLGM